MSALVVPNPRPQSTYYSHAPYMTNFGKPPGLMGRTYKRSSEPVSRRLFFDAKSIYKANLAPDLVCTAKSR